MAGRTGTVERKGSLLSQYLVTILTVAGTIGAAAIPILLNANSAQISNKPGVNLAVIPNLDNDGRKALIELTNHGSGTATNLSLTIQAPKNISTITNWFSSTYITIPNLDKNPPNANTKSLDMHVLESINQFSLKMNISKFSAGSGSIMKLKISMDSAKQNLSYYNYTISAAYDQGSVMGKVIKPSDELSLSNFPNKIAQYIVENSILVASEIAIIPVGWITIKWWLGKRFRGYLISNMIHSILLVRNDLASYDYSVGVGEPIVLNYFVLEVQDISTARRELENRFDLVDLILIDDLLNKLSRRTTYVKLLHPLSPSSKPSKNID
jgi:hypothetical protein